MGIFLLQSDADVLFKLRMQSHKSDRMCYELRLRCSATALISARISGGRSHEQLRGFQPKRQPARADSRQSTHSSAASRWGCRGQTGTWVWTQRQGVLLELILRPAALIQRNGVRPATKAVPDIGRRRLASVALARRFLHRHRSCIACGRLLCAGMHAVVPDQLARANESRAPSHRIAPYQVAQTLRSI